MPGLAINRMEPAADSTQRTPADPVDHRPLYDSSPLATYCEDLRKWMDATRQWQYECTFKHHQLLSSIYCASRPTIGAGATVELARREGRPRRSPTQGAPTRFDGRGVGQEFLLPPLWKRALAEVIDFSLLLIIKVFTSFLMINLLGMSALQVFDFDYAFINGELDLDKLVSMSSEIFVVEMIHRVLVSIYEALCLAYAAETAFGGATPGKRMLNMVVVSCSQVLTIGGGRVLITPGTTLSLPTALLRSLVKNFAITFFLPTCLSVMVFDYGRAAYDILAGTIVVESNRRHR